MTQTADSGPHVHDFSSRLILSGRAVPVPGRMEKLSPVTGNPIASFAVAGPEQVEEAVKSARAAQRAWGGQAVWTRAAILGRVRDVFARETESIADLITCETGKPLMESLFEVATAIACLDYVAGEAPTLLAQRHFRLPQPPFLLKKNTLAYRPYGVCALISPWNFPLAIPVGEIAQALVGGNAVVFKPSELSPFTGLRLAELFLEGGLPGGLLEVVTGDGTTGARLVESPIDKCSFTGSFATGIKIASSCLARGIPYTAELGGKDPAIVLEDAELTSAVRGVLWCACMNAGQGCSATERVYVARPLHDRFLELAKAVASNLRVGDGREPRVEVGPLIAQRQIDKVRAHVDDAIGHGACAVAGGRPLADLGPFFYAPTVLSGVDHTMAVMREETFGPVAPVMPFDTEEEAIRLANDSPYGLGATVWTGDVERGERIAGELRAGSVWVNDALFSHSTPQAPWGGAGQSGHSRTHGPWGILAYVQLQYVSSDAYTHTLKDGWFPYGPARLGYTRAAVDFLYRPGLGRKLASLPRLLSGFIRRAPRS